MNHLVSSLNHSLDHFFIAFYRLTDLPIVNFFIGTFSLALICVVVGELSVSLALKYNKHYLDRLGSEMKEKEKLAIQAYEAGDKSSYKALNKQATDVWGKRFFTMVAYSAGILWPIPFALGWMETRFRAVDFPLAFPLSIIFGHSVGYTFTFIPLYILGRIIFKYLRPVLPYFKGIQRLLDEADTK